MSRDGGVVGDNIGLEGTLGNILKRRKSHNRFRDLSITPKGMVDFSSNGYLSLSSNVEVQRTYLSRLQQDVAVAAAERATGSSGSSSGNQETVRLSSSSLSSPLLGSEGSRLLDGNSSFAEGLERKIAAFHGAPAALLFVSAFDANVGLLGCVPQPGDIIVYDELIHASVHDGMRLSRAGRRLPFSHVSVTRESAIEERGGLGYVLRELAGGSEDVRKGKRNVFVCVESVYSMDGDVLRLKAVVDCVEKSLPCKNGYIILDEAHSTGVVGARGRGLACELGLENQVWARVLGLGKAMGCSGGMYADAC